ncbi:putative leucine-rich repeat receptor-like protein kinase IMK3 [Dichanthelium oligosanthes]|uniref:Putative leucine-rich repeat receptor-like protein kinase IMK3 n=1 Tax=Dichanthelium oligosanthes TaxID=888268 RepID=A0A1E5W5I1_9POAL|nr:putative leucine-rich repeat receptor-like protein kinase IMK3 [Dichanthelium oligosanthes]
MSVQSCRRGGVECDAGSRRKRRGGGLFVLPLALRLLLLLLLAAAAVPARGQPSDGLVIAQADLQGLQAIRQALVDPRGFLASWNGTGLDACSGGWAGIKCAQGKVVAIQLPFKGLAGSLSDKLGQLTALRRLSFHDNIIGGQVPAAIGFLRELRGVYLHNNRFAGAVSPALGGCALLQTLDLSGNYLSGSIPSTLANATRLYRINLAYNNLSGVVPSSLTSLPFLESLELGNNNLSGAMPPTIGNLRLLHDLSLGNNLISGSIPDGIGNLSKLRTLDLSDNLLGGSLPASLCNLTSLVELNLDGNDIGGHIPECFDGIKNLTKLSLKRNVLDGEIPATVGNLSALSLLDVSENNLTGEIPASLTGLASLSYFNVSYNNLSGPVPVVLSNKFNSTSFVGNLQLCGFNGSAICTSASSPVVSPSPPLPLLERRTRKLNKKELIFAVAGILFLFLLLFCCVLLFWRKDKKESSSPKKGGKDATTTKTVGKPGSGSGTDGGGDGGGKLVHFDGPLSFTADDLLCATAEILGKSTYGTVYKATMEDGSYVAVKRLREKIAKSQKEFEAEVNALGKLRHPNLLALRAYYLGPKGEKLLVFDYMPKGNLASFLHARAPDSSPVDWPTRMNIAVGVARGLHHLHTDANMVHGNLTSNNILLDEGNNAKIADCGLSRLMSAAANSSVITAAGALGYRAPELSKLKKANTKTDIYSLGVVMLELLTGKSPGDTTNGLDLPQWVASVVEEEWTNEVFDLELMKDAAAGSETGEELVKTLKLALHCVDPSPPARPEAQQALRQLEQIKPSIAVSAASSFTGEPSHTTATATSVTDETKSTITE